MKKKKHLTPEEVFGTKKIFEYFEHDGKYYEQSATDGRPTFIEVPKKKIDEQLKMAKELAKKLKDNLDAEKVLIEIFMAKYDKENLDKLYKTVFKSKKKYKPKTREGYCVDMKVGNHIIPIID